MYICLKLKMDIKEFKLFNVLTDEIYEIKNNLINLEKMINYLIKFKYFNTKDITDKEFLENCSKFIN